MRTAVLVVSLYLMAGRALATEASILEECAAHLPAAHLTLRIAPIKERLSTDHTLEQINREAPQSSRDSMTLGLTRPQIFSELTASMPNWRSSQSDLICGTPQVQLSLNFIPQVYISSEFAPGSCAYAAILAHEKKHVAVVGSFAAWAEQDLGPEIDRELAGKFLTGRTAAQLKAKLDQLLELLQVRLKTAEGHFLEQEHAVDSPEEYRRVQAQCPQLQALKRPAQW